MLNLGARVFAGFGAGFRQPDWKRGPIAMISQSGGFAYSIMAYCQEAGIGMDYMVSTGNEADLGVLDFVEHFLEDDEVRLIAVYLEGLKDGRRLRALGPRALEVGKPIAVWKVGNTAVGQRAAVSHTANLTEEYDFYRDAFSEGGFVEIREVYDLVDAAKVFRSGKRPAGRRAAIVTTSGGAGVLLADRCEEVDVELPALSEATLAELKALLPSFASMSNPIDFTAALAQKEPEFTPATGLVIGGRQRRSRDRALVSRARRRGVGRQPGRACGRVREADARQPERNAGPGRRVGAAARRGGRAVLRSAEPRRGGGGDAVRFRGTRAAGATRRRAVASCRRGVSISRARPAASTKNEAKRCLEAYGIATPRRVFVDADAAVSRTYRSAVSRRREDRLARHRAQDRSRRREAARAPSLNGGARWTRYGRALGATLPTRASGAFCSKRWRKASR